MVAQNLKRVVYIEDDPEMIELVSLILNKHGFEVLGVDGGRQGLDIVSQEQPALVLLDLMMPDVDGWDVYQQIKTHDTTKKIPVIIITAKAQAIDKVLGLHIAKVDDYLCKPFHPQQLLESIQRVLEKTTDNESQPLP